MNDRYLYRAKRADNGEWVEGFLFDDGMINPEHYFIGSIVIEPYKGTADDDWNITGHCFYEVDPSTLCACTGLKDKNGKLIWENDVVRYTDMITSDEKIDCIEWNETHASFVRLHRSQMGLQYLYIDEFIANRCEVVGSAIDNIEIHFRNTEDCIERIKSIKEMYAKDTPSEVALRDAIKALENTEKIKEIISNAIKWSKEDVVVKAQAFCDIEKIFMRGDTK